MADPNQEQLAKEVEEALDPKVHLLQALSLDPGLSYTMCNLLVPDDDAVDAGDITCLACREARRVL